MFLPLFETLKVIVDSKINTTFALTNIKKAMNKKIVITIGVISLIADIITLTSAFKFVLTNLFNVGNDTAKLINGITFIIATIVLIGTLIYPIIYLGKKLRDAGTHGIECALIPYLRYKTRNKMNTLLRSLHCNLYHTIVDLKKYINRQRRQRASEQQNTPISVNDIEAQLRSLLRSFHTTLYDVFHLDLSISIYLIGRENENTVLTRCSFLQSLKEQNRGEQRQMNYNYIIHNSNNQNEEAYVINARNYINQNPNSPYKKNSIFDYVLTTNNSSWISNDLRIDEQKGIFYSSSQYYKRKYKSLAVFAIIPPSNGNNRAEAIKGLLTFDTHNTRMFSEEECTMLMGLMAHQVYEVLDCLN